VRAFLKKHGSGRFRLSETYPRGVNPFEWDPRLEATVLRMEEPKTLDQLLVSGLSSDVLASALAALFLADMVETLEPPSGPVSVAQLPAFPEPRVVPNRTSISSPDLAPLSLAPMPIPSVPASEPHEAERASIAARLDPLLGKSYYDVLRIIPSSSKDQIERAYRFLERQLHDEDPGVRAFRDLIAEAYAAITGPELGPRYRELAERSMKNARALQDRCALEAEPKIERASIAMAQGRTGEAAYLLGWAQELDALRRDLRAHRAFLAYARTPPDERRDVAKGLKAMIAHELTKAPADLRLQLYLAVAHAGLGETAEARAILARTEDRPHPLREVVQALLG
jgi:hypothetical protein